MIKDILVHVPTERPARPVIDASISIAAGFGAHLDAMAVGYVAASAAFVGAGVATAAAAAIGHSSPLRILSLRAETSFLFRIG